MVKAAVAVELLGAGLLLVATAASCKPPSCNPSGRRLARPSATPSLGMSATVKSPSASAQTDTPISAASLYAIFYLPNGSNWSFPLSQGDALHSHPDFDADKNATVFFVPGYTVKPTAEGVRLAIKAFTTKHESFNFLLLDWTLYSGRPYVAAAMNMGQRSGVRAAVLTVAHRGALRPPFDYANPPTRTPACGGGAARGLAGEAARGRAGRGPHVAGGAVPRRAPRRQGGRRHGCPPGARHWPGPRAPALLVRVAADAPGPPAGDLRRRHPHGRQLAGHRRPRQHRAPRLLAQLRRRAPARLPFGLVRVRAEALLWRVASAGCSHRRALWYFAESVLNRTAFPAVLCPRGAAFLAGLCPPANSTTVYMGLAASPSGPEGSYMLRTAGASPFGLGLDGLVPVANDVVDNDPIPDKDPVADDPAAKGDPLWEWAVEYPDD
ncbi:uncharacterized protein LOC113207038 isoform X2 [Frankliniella occidentalis]|uniref:Uncharacterized protein LOC113207038 isoform X2 n=1 Tax=Frankliniella occidentalis TaxID=133901 RepID=A0A9C6X7X9_FRAOC|nr:uncharacterized protein LOC113207038 isoform X2 [Frankliniella occidentalis]